MRRVKQDGSVPALGWLFPELLRPQRATDRLKVYFDFADWWVGLYVGPNHVYVCLLPTLVIRWARRPSRPRPTGITPATWAGPDESRYWR